MSKISEQKALEAYPESLYIGYPDSWSRYKTLREGYIKGYDQAMQDFMEKACDWLSKQPMSRPVFWTVEDFKNYMQDE